jgi:UDP-N-acetylglucosamine transferase subunit ALG13
MPKVRCYTQSESWADSRWKYAGSVFDGFAGHEVDKPAGPLRVVVTVGSMQHPMTRLVKELEAVLPEDAEVAWQLGNTPPIPGMRASRIEKFVGHDELTDLMSDAHVVVCHAGVGSVLQAVSVGKSPILVPRRPEHGEHVDEHQEQIAAQLGKRGIATAVDAEDLTTDLLYNVASRGVRKVDAPRSLQLRSLRVANHRPARTATTSVPRTLTEPVAQRRA